jgi:periplasmic copper chaperone A
MIRSATLLAACVALASCSGKAELSGSQAWVRLPAVVGRPGAAFFTIKGGRADDRLIEAASAVAVRTELHATEASANGMMTMRRLPAVDVPAGATVTFAPGGRHVMLFGLDPSIKPGTAVPLRLGFASGRTVELEAKTVPPGEAAPY